jgi:hypothetical protein
MSRAAIVIALAMGVASFAGAQQPSRDATRATASATGIVAGTVVDDEGRPVPRAVVSLSAPELKPSRGVITDDNGRFRFAGMPPGRFSIVVERASFITSAYGAKRAGRAGTSITLAAGAALDGLVVRLWRGAELAGIVRDEHAAPVPGVPVTAIPAHDSRAGGLPSLSNNGVVTNELGEYRIFGLEPGAYVISARPSWVTGGPLTSMTDAQVDAALELLKRRGAAPPGVRSSPLPSAGSPRAEPLRPFAYPPIYHPGTALVEQATSITLKIGEERTGIDITLQRVATFTVDGVVNRPDGSPASGAVVQLTRVRTSEEFTSGPPTVVGGTADANGRFRVMQVLPGDYRAVARVPSVPSGGSSSWASADLSVTGADVQGIALTAAPGVSLPGRVVFASSATPRTATPDVRGLRVSLLAPWILNLGPRTPIDAMGVFNTATVQPDGTFRWTGLLPATYVLQLNVAGGAIPGPWFARSAMLGDRDLFDSPTDITREMGNVPLVITYSDRPTEISGTLQTDAGAPSSDVFVIAYSTDHRFWVARSRRVQAVRPGVDGRFVFNALPPGDYLLGAVTDVDPDDWLEPGFLDRLTAASVKVTLGEGEKRVQNLAMGK